MRFVRIAAVCETCTNSALFCQHNELDSTDSAAEAHESVQASCVVHADNLFALVCAFPGSMICQEQGKKKKGKLHQKRKPAESALVCCEWLRECNCE